MEPKLAPKSKKNWCQEGLNKKDEKWSQKSHAGAAVVCGGVRPGGWGGPLNSVNPVSPEGPEGQPLPLGHSPRAQGGTVADKKTASLIPNEVQILAAYFCRVPFARTGT